MRTFCAAFSTLIAFFSQEANAEVSSWKKVGAWDVSFYDSLPGCLASTTYEDGTGFFIGFISSDAGLLLDITLISDKWASIEDGKEYDVSAQIGDEAPWTIEMSGRDFGGSPGLNFAIDATSDQAIRFVGEFQRELTMYWSYRGVELGHFVLRGSRAAMNEAIQCQRSFNAALNSVSDPFSLGTGSGSDDPFAQ